MRQISKSSSSGTSGVTAMLRSVFTKTMRDRRKAMLWWISGSAAYMLVIVLTWSAFNDPGLQESLNKLMEAYPPEMLAVVGMSPGQSMLSPVGYLTAEAFGWMVPLLLLILASGMGARAIAGEEEAKTMDLLLSNPISRTSVVVQKMLAMLVLVALVGVAIFLGIAVGVSVVGMDISVAYLGAATLQAVMLGLGFGALALALGAATGNRGLALGVVSAVALATFLVQSIGPLADWPRWSQKLSPFYYYAAHRPLENGLSWGDLGVLTTIVVVLVTVAVLLFARRDVRV